MIKRLVAKFMFRAMTIWDALRTFRGSSATLWVPQEGLASPPFPLADGPDVVQLLASDSAGGTVKPTSAYWNAVMADSPIVYMPLANGAVDVSGHGYDGVATNVSWTPDPSVALPSGFIGAAAVTGNGYVELPSTLSLSGSFTVEIWGSVATTSNGALVGSRNLSGTSTSSNTFDFGFSAPGSTGLHSDIGDGSAWLTTAANSPFDYTTNTLYYLVENVTPSGWAQFINAIQTATGTYTSATPVLTDTDNPLFVGSNGSGTTGTDNGLLAQFAIYSPPLSSARISAHYSAAFEV